MGVAKAWDFKKQGVAKLDFWTSPGVPAGNRFLSEFAPYARRFGSSVRFIPHFHVVSLPNDYNGMCIDGQVAYCAEDGTVMSCGPCPFALFCGARRNHTDARRNQTRPARNLRGRRLESSRSHGRRQLFRPAVSRRSPSGSHNLPGVVAPPGR